MTTIRNIFQEFGPEYVERFGDAMPNDHLKAIEAIIECRTPSCGVTVYECTKCGEIHHFFRGCGNRNCPTCQHQKGLNWMETQLERQLPGLHFMVTFNVPAAIRDFIRSHQRAAYSALFKSSSDSMKKLARDEKYIGGDLPGFFGVLHTWGRQLQYHPHIHYVVPGGAFSTKDGKWHPSRLDFYLPVHALSKIYRAKFRDLMKKEGLFHMIPPDVWKIDWNVNIQAVGTAEKTVRYLSPYVFKVAISDHRIVKVEDRKVTFSYRKRNSSRPRHLTVDVMEFIRRFLQHVLPTGFMKVRYYGFMNPNSSVSLDNVRGLIEISCGFEIKTPEIETREPDPLSCPLCGGVLKYLYSILPFQIPPQEHTGEKMFHKPLRE